MKFKIINLFDKIFITISIFLVVYAWINFFIRDLWQTFFFSLIFTSALTFVLFYCLNKKSVKKNLNKQHFIEVEKNFLAFQTMGNLERLKLIKNIIEKSCVCTKFKESLVYSKNDLSHQIMIEIDCEKLSQHNLQSLISKRKNGVKSLTIICSDFDQNLNTKILKNLEVKIVNKTALYDEYFFPNNIFPNCSDLETNIEKKGLKQIIKNFIQPHKSKSYFFCGLILIFSSIILPFHTYYLIFGSVLIIVSIACKFQKIIHH